MCPAEWRWRPNSSVTSATTGRWSRRQQAQPGTVSDQRRLAHFGAGGGGWCAGMTLLRSYPSRDALGRPRNRAADVVVFVGAAVLIWGVVRISASVAVPLDETSAPATVSTDT